MKRTALAIAACLFSIPAQAQSINVAGWDVAPIAEGSAGSGCMMAADYDGGTRVGLVMFRDYSWGITLYNASWRLTEGSKVKVEAYVDNRPLASGTADIVAPNLALLELQGASAYQALQAGHKLELYTNVGEVRLRLTGTGKAMSAVLSCVGRINEQQPKVDARSSNPEKGIAVSHAEAAVMVANIFNAASVHDYKLLPPSNGKDGLILFTLSDGSSGAFFAFKGRGTPSADDAVGAVISNGATDCKGDFLSGKQSLPSTDGSVIRKVVATCRSQGTATVTETTIIRRETGFLLTFQHTSPEQIGVSDANGASSISRPGLLDAALTIDEPGAR